MTETLRQPDKAIQAQAEIDQVLGKRHTNSIQEYDISKLPYNQAVVKETLRLHPPAPFLVPYKTTMDVELCGQRMPKNALVWVNVWSMGRGPSICRITLIHLYQKGFLRLTLMSKVEILSSYPLGHKEEYVLDMVRCESTQISGPLLGETISDIGSGMGLDRSVWISGIGSVLPGQITLLKYILLESI